MLLKISCFFLLIRSSLNHVPDIVSTPSWGWTDSAECDCDQEVQTMDHIMQQRCPLRAYPGPPEHLFDLTPDAANWLKLMNNKVEQYCVLAQSCYHDVIPICGKMGEKTRTFLDTCDLLEYGCDTNEIYVHVEDIPGCPIANIKSLFGATDPPPADAT